MQLSFQFQRICSAGLSGTNPNVYYGVAFANTANAQYNPRYVREEARLRVRSGCRLATLNTGRIERSASYHTTASPAAPSSRRATRAQAASAPRDAFATLAGSAPEPRARVCNTEHPKKMRKAHCSLEHTARVGCFDFSVRGGLPAQLLVPRWPDVRPLLSRLPGRRQRRQRHLRPYVQTPLSKKGPGELIDQ